MFFIFYVLLFYDPLDEMIYKAVLSYFPIKDIASIQREKFLETWFYFKFSARAGEAILSI